MAVDTQLIYEQRINRVIDYIESHLDDSLSLDTLASIACFSPYHFHRIFHAFQGEAPFRFIRRIRLERAAYLLDNRNISVTDLAMESGFQEASSFSKAFKEEFGLSPRNWKKRKREHVFPERSDYTKQERGIKPVELYRQSLDDQLLYYLRHTGSYAGDGELFAKLYRRLIGCLDRTILPCDSDSRFAVVYHDPLGLAASNSLRISLGLLSQKQVSGELPGGLSVMKLKGGCYLIASFLLEEYRYGEAWSLVYRRLLPSWGYEPADTYAFERYAPDCYDRESGLCRLDICVPVEQVKGE